MWFLSSVHSIPCTKFLFCSILGYSSTCRWLNSAGLQWVMDIMAQSAGMVCKWLSDVCLEPIFRSLHFGVNSLKCLIQYFSSKLWNVFPSWKHILLPFLVAKPSRKPNNKIKMICKWYRINFWLWLVSFYNQ